MAVALRGALIAVGGGEDKVNEMTILRRAFELAPPEPRVAIVPTASRDPLWASALHVAAFQRLAASAVDVVDIRDQAQASEETHVERLRSADIVYMTGGDQGRLTGALAGSPALAAIRDKLASGGVVVGTSAGAAAMSTVMIARGDGHLRDDNLVLSPGLGLLPGAIFDTHFTERGRFGRLLEAVSRHPKLLGLGLGEDTAVIVRGADVEVVGSGHVIALDGRELRSSTLPDEAEPRLSVERLVVHAYTGGASFRLDPPEPIGSPRRTRARA